jgi:hypothetical protein
LEQHTRGRVDRLRGSTHDWEVEVIELARHLNDEDEVNLPDSKSSTVKGLVHIVNYQKTPVRL